MTSAERDIAVVSGAASGMGYAVAARFVAEGWRVLALDLAAAGLAQTQDALGEQLVPVAVDLCDRAAVEAALTAYQGSGGVTAVVNAAGIYPTTTLGDYTEQTYRRIFDVNVLGTLNLTAAAVPLIRAHGRGGAVVNFASIDAFAVSRGQLIYSASRRRSRPCPSGGRPPPRRSPTGSSRWPALLAPTSPGRRW